MSGNLTRLIVVLGVIAAVGCSAGDEGESPLQLVMWRGVVGNPPQFDLVLANADGSNLQVVTGTSVPGGVRPRLFDDPAWSPDGRTIAFTADLSKPYGRGGFPKTDIYLVRADGSGLRRLTEHGSSGSPTWSPDGRTIAYTRSRDSSTSLWTTTVSGESEQALSEAVDGRFDSPGAWSPDGSQLVFSRGRLALPDEGGRFENTNAIYVIDADGSRLTKLADRGADPTWSPDGTRILFASDRDENGELSYGDSVAYANELYVMAADGSNERRLTKTQDLNERRPDWSPDATVIAYQRGEVVDNAQGTGVFVINAAGTCRRPIAFDPDLDVWYSSPAWRPGGALARQGRFGTRC